MGIHKVQSFARARADGSTYRVNFHRGSPAVVALRYSTENVGTLLAEGMRAYTGDYTGNPISSEDFERLAKDAGRTKLSTPIEMVYFTFLIQNVSRSWTHQAVRYRIATAFIQQSMRVFGKGNEYNVLATRNDEKHADRYYEAILNSIQQYDAMIEEGCPVQDARGVLPHHILTAMYWSMSLRTLMTVYNTRMCCQAQQDEWLPVLRQMKAEVRRVCGDLVADMITAPIDRGESCGYGASIDAPCVWRDRTGSKLSDDKIDNLIGSDTGSALLQAGIGHGKTKDLGKVK